MAITDWPAAERPRERLLALGPARLSDAELVAVFLRSGVAGKSAVELARELIGRFGGMAGLLGAGTGALGEVKGLGGAKVAHPAAGAGEAPRPRGGGPPGGGERPGRWPTVTPDRPQTAQPLPRPRPALDRPAEIHLHLHGVSPFGHR